jgi:hypothetical protein
VVPQWLPSFQSSVLVQPRKNQFGQIATAALTKSFTGFGRGIFFDEKQA